MQKCLTKNPVDELKWNSQKYSNNPKTKQTRKNKKIKTEKK